MKEARGPIEIENGQNVCGHTYIIYVCRLNLKRDKSQSRRYAHNSRLRTYAT